MPKNDFALEMKYKNSGRINGSIRASHTGEGTFRMQANGRSNRKRARATPNRVVAPRPRLSRSLTTRSYVDPVYRFTRTQDFGNLATSTTSTTNLSIKYQLSQLGTVTDFTNLFDQYRIVKVETTLYPSCTSSEATASAVLNGYGVKAIDYDDGNSTNFGDLLQFGNATHFRLTDPIKTTIVPRLSMPTYGSSVFSSFSMAPKNQWVDCASTTAEYYGLKIAWPVVPINTITYSIVTKFFLEFRHAR